MSKIIWAGGPHGVGKTSSLKLAVAKNPSLNYLYLGRMFYETADEMGFRWMELADKSTLLYVEEVVSQKMKKRLENSNLLIDCHFAIHFGEKVTYPGFHSQNLKDLFYENNAKKGVLYLTADPETILQRRVASKKRIKSYITQQDRDIVSQEILDSENYFSYFTAALNPNVTSRKIDTSNISLDKVVDKIGEMYHAM